MRPGRRINWDLLAERLAAALICPLRGHWWREKMNGLICNRCAVYRPYKRVYISGRRVYCAECNERMIRHPRPGCKNF